MSRHQHSLVFSLMTIGLLPKTDTATVPATKRRDERNETTGRKGKR